MQTAIGDLIELGTARRTLIPRKDGTAVSPSTVWRWVRKGINGVKLQVWYVGAKPHTTPQALQQFFDEVTAKRLASIAQDNPQLLTASDAELVAAGLLK